MRRGGNSPSSAGAGRVRLVPPVVPEFLRRRVRPRRKKALLAGVMVWSLVVAPAIVLLAGLGDAWGAIPLGLGIACFVFMPMVVGIWDYELSVLRGFLTVAPLSTAAVLLAAAPFLVPYALHDMVGHSVRARVMEVWSTPLGGTDEEDPDRLSYRISDAVTEQDLGVLLWGLPERTPVGTVVEVSVVPGGWSPPFSAERLDDGTARLAVTVFRDMTAAHVLACAVVWFGWPRKDVR